MPKYTQTGRPLALTTPLGVDALLLAGLSGPEKISSLFRFTLDLVAEVPATIAFDRILGQSVTAELVLPGQSSRFFNGIVRRFTQCGRDQEFVRFQAEIVPKQWLLTKRVRSRIFQRVTIPEILKLVLAGFSVDYQVSAVYQPREYCVQYRESDFAFISRLMEEEGIYYYFEHTDGQHRMMVTDISNHHPPLPGGHVFTYEELSGGFRDDLRITRWEKSQEIRSGEYTLRDHSFELPSKTLQVSSHTLPAVTVGKVTHKLKVGGNDQCEIYDYPGGYANRFDGVSHTGADQTGNLRKMFADSQRTVKLRMEQEEASALRIDGESHCPSFCPGFQFTLENHFDGDGPYLITRVFHRARLEGDYRSADALPFRYSNRFSCAPAALPYRPRRVTPRPVIQGFQTAVVAGPEGEDLFCDKYGRIKVQFHWDREEARNADSSCWLRVSQVWAGRGWGSFFWPRIGHEVVVAFEDGDPDRPLVTGSVYNAENVPPFRLPQMKDFAGFKSASIQGSPTSNYNGLLFVDRKGQEHLAIHSERHLVMNAEFDRSFTTGRHHGERVPAARTVTVGRIPGTGGGSGGGGPNKATWTPFEPQGLLGLNSTMVYGTNVQVACPLNFQVAVGSNLQVCINPSAWQTLYGDGGESMSSQATDVLGAGLGGNMQLTMGTSANFVMGQVFDINLGPRRITLDLHKKTAIQPCCEYLGTWLLATSAIYVVVYGLAQDDDARTLITVVYQLLTQEIIAALMDIQQIYHAMDDYYKKQLNTLYSADPDHPTDDAFANSFVSSKSYDGALMGTAIVTSMVTPILLEIAGESKLHAEPATQTYEVADASGNDIGTVTI
jgi:type VI secretion system secreted protein VgrG